MSKVIKSYEDQTVKIAELEKKLKNLKIRHERELKIQEEQFYEKLKNKAIETIDHHESKTYRKISSVERNCEEVKSKVERFKNMIEKKLTCDSNRVQLFNLEYG
jgi:hypothetical protein